MQLDRKGRSQVALVVDGSCFSCDTLTFQIGFYLSSKVKEEAPSDSPSELAIPHATYSHRPVAVPTRETLHHRVTGGAPGSLCT